MSTAAVLVRRLFGQPGSAATDAEQLQDQAAAVHAELLRRACLQPDPDLARVLTPLTEFLRGAAPPEEKRLLLCDPLFVEGLHGLAPVCPALRQWHETVAGSSARPLLADGDEAASASLGNVALVQRLRTEPIAQEQHVLCTDVLGRLGFPFCHWSLLLTTDNHALLSGRRVTLVFDGEQVRWHLADGTGVPFLVLSERACRRLLVANHEPTNDERPHLGIGELRPRLQCACALGHGRMHYDPVAFQDFDAHAGLTGALVQKLLCAIERHSPAVYREFRACITTIRGFEFPLTDRGVVGSFSDPTIPGIMGINVSYTPQHEPCIDPFCLTWFGHELGHTKDYLIDTILYGIGKRLLRNPEEQTAIIPRYGRSLTLRTLFQVPYVHLYEWTLLMDFWKAGFTGLPWPVPGNVSAVGDDLAAEIVEAFALIEDRAQLTPLGVAALRHFRELYGIAQGRWRSMRRRAS